MALWLDTSTRPKELQNRGVKAIRFVGIIDAVSTGILGVGSAPLKLAGIVQKAFHAVKDPLAEFYALDTHEITGATLTIQPYTFSLTTARRGGKATRHQFMGISATVRGDLVKAAIAAGVPLKK